MNNKKSILFKVLLIFLFIVVFLQGSTPVFANGLSEKRKALNKHFKEYEQNNTGALDNSGLAAQKISEYKNAGIISPKAAERMTIENDSKINNLAGDANVEDFDKAFQGFVSKYNEIVYFIMGFATLSSFLIFIIIFLRLTFLPTFPAQRRKAMIDIVVSGISTALLGAISVIIKLYYSSFSAIVDNQLMLSLDWRITGSILLYEFRTLIMGIFGVATLTTIIMFARALMMVASSSNNPSKRAEAKTNLFYTIAGTAGLGSITLFVGYFTNILR